MACLRYIAVLVIIAFFPNSKTNPVNRCLSNQFLCADNNLCIPNNWKCDGTGDCLDSSDEQSCALKSGCGSSSLFNCQNGKCILSSWLCDGENDCNDNSDEIEELCGKKENCTGFTCDNGKCLSSTWMCDNYDDCGDNSDERLCGSTSLQNVPTTERSTTTRVETTTTTAQSSRCMSSEFECSIQSSCIPKEWKCDGSPDCTDETDEKDCGGSSTQQADSSLSRCSSSSFSCDNKCIPLLWKCDNENDCNDGTDEAFCNKSTTSNKLVNHTLFKITTPPTTEKMTTSSLCFSTDFECSLEKRCIPRELACDGKEDCHDGSDESNCSARVATTPMYVRALAEAKNVSTLPTVVCSEGKFLCSSGLTCTFDAWRCDGDEDCGDGSDEQNCDVQQTTQSSGSSCGEGYFTCETSRRCIVNQWLCDNERDCLDGSDEHGCALAISIYATAGTKIVKLSEDLSSSETVISRLAGAVAIDVDVQTQAIYFSDVRRKQIKKTYLNGGGEEVIISRDIGIVEGIAVDWVARKLYWTDCLASTIDVSELRGNNRKTLVSKGLSYPRAIVAHPSGYIFWTEWGGHPKISRISSDGRPATRKILIDLDIAWPNALTIDHQNEQLWWADAKLNKIERCGLDGTNREIIKRNVGLPFSLAVSSRFLYLSNWGNGKVERMEKGSWNINKVASPAFSQKVSGITLINGETQKSVNTECSNNNGGCSHLCVLSSGGTYSCLCPDNLRLDRDKRTCVSRIGTSCSIEQFRCDDNICIDASKQCDGTQDCEDGTDEHYCLTKPARLVFGDRQRYLGLCILQGSNQCSSFKAVQETTSIIGLDVDVKNSIIYWSDSNKNAIMKSAITAQGNLLWTRVVTDKYVFTPQGLAFDWVTNKIYWADRFSRKIEVIDTEGTNRYTIVDDNLRKPRSIALHPKSGYLFWTDWGKRPYLAKIAMDGNPDTRRKVVETGIVQPNSVTIDYSRDVLYWADSALDKIEKMDVNGGSRLLFLRKQLVYHPFALTFYKHYLYWSDWHLQGILRVGMNKQQDSIVKKPISHAMEFAIFDKNRQQAIANPCALFNGGCSHICLINPISGFRRSCKCPKTMSLRKDKKSCESLYRPNDNRYIRTNSLYDIGLL